MTSRTIDPPAVVETRVVHNAHRRATSLLADVTRTPSGVKDEVDQLRELVVAMLRHHHEREDHDLWALLTSAAPMLETSLALLSAEHERLDAALLRLARERDAAAADEVRDMLHAHLTAEEPILFPALREHLADAEWDGFSERTVASTPLIGTDLLVALLHEVAADDDEVALILRHLPAEASALLPAKRAAGEQTLVALCRAAA